MRFLAFLSIIAQLASALAVRHEDTTSLIPRALQPHIINCNADQTAWISQALTDAQTLAQSADPFLPPQSWVTSLFYGIPELEKRYFGSDIDRSNDFKPAMIRNVIANISRKNIPSSNKFACETKVGSQIQRIGAYALSEHKNPEIVICPPAFAKNKDGSWSYNSLSDKKAFLDKNPGYRTEPGWWKTTGHLMLHELTHLQFIEGTTSVMVHDHDMNSDSAKKVYGARDCERFATFKENSKLVNADNIAWYVTIKYFSQFYGDPGPVYKKPSGSKAVVNNIAFPPSSKAPADAHNVTSVTNIALSPGSKAPAAVHNVTVVNNISHPPSSKAPAAVHNVKVAFNSGKLTSQSGIALIPGTEDYLEAADKFEHPDNYLEDAYDNESPRKTCILLVQGTCMDGVPTNGGTLPGR